MSVSAQTLKPLPRWVDLAGAAFSAAFFVWLAFGRGNPGLRTVADVLFFLPPGCAVAWLTWRTARTWPHDSPTRRAWQRLALSYFLTWLGGSLWTGLLLVSPRLAESNFGDALSLPAYPLALWGVLSFPGLYRSGASRVRMTLDTAMIVVGAGLAIFYFGYLPALASHEATGGALYIAFIFPAIDIALIAMTWASSLRASHPATRTALRWMAASKVALLLGDGYYGFLRLTAGYYAGHWIDAFWFAAWMLAWISARSVQLRVEQGTIAAPAAHARSFRSEGLPLLFVVWAQGLLLWILRGRLGTPIGIAAIAASVIAALIVLRQLGELREHNRLFERERRKEARFRSLVQQGNDFLLVVDAGGVILYRSPSAERLFGPAAELAALLESADAGSQGALLSRMQAGDVEGPFPVRFRRADGTLVHLEFVGTDLRADPAVRGVVLTGRDVSERKLLEDEVLHAEKIRAIGQLAGGFAHDFNNILAGLRGHLDLISEELPPDSQLRLFTADIAHAADSAAAITRQLLQFGKREVVRPETLDLNAVLAEFEPMIRGVLPPAIALRIEYSAGPLWILVDRSQTEQVVLNLALNARDAMTSGGALLLRTAAEADSAALLVRDEGSGMDEQTLARIFEPFFTTKAPGQGTGLGLANVHAHVTGAGGRVLVKSAPGQGTAFTVLLPRVPPPAERRVSSLQPPRAADGAGARVLLVEDEEIVRRVALRILERNGYRVTPARSGEEALDLLARGAQVDLVVTDLMMPGMGGAGLMARLAERFPRLPVVCMSGHAADEASRRHASSAVVFLPKPFSADDLSRVAATALARSAG
jgi:PAS domain S-box-containing protein